MRLTIALGYRSVREMEETLGADEWADWLVFHSLYDLPDGFLVAGQICALVSHALGNKAKPSDFVPYYAPPPKESGSKKTRSAPPVHFAFLRENVPHLERK